MGKTIPEQRFSKGHGVEWLHDGVTRRQVARALSLQALALAEGVLSQEQKEAIDFFQYEYGRLSESCTSSLHAHGGGGTPSKDDQMARRIDSMARLANLTTQAGDHYLAMTELLNSPDS